MWYTSKKLFFLFLFMRNVTFNIVTFQKKSTISQAYLHLFVYICISYQIFLNSYETRGKWRIICAFKNSYFNHTIFILDIFFVWRIFFIIIILRITYNSMWTTNINDLYKKNSLKPHLIFYKSGKGNS